MGTIASPPSSSQDYHTWDSAFCGPGQTLCPKKEQAQSKWHVGTQGLCMPGKAQLAQRAIIHLCKEGGQQGTQLNFIANEFVIGFKMVVTGFKKKDQKVASYSSASTSSWSWNRLPLHQRCLQHHQRALCQSAEAGPGPTHGHVSAAQGHQTSILDIIHIHREALTNDTVSRQHVAERMTSGSQEQDFFGHFD
ncbi:hypothetical protein P7K49_021169 [Saguinus oedipus]|uniref:Uncharacterized protein n=1 Tax=Saguinus oedipus TaxID=9490 RepID=A0ABQ9URX3_SAGOE|nr:hypothetical protein P7K49_021169 [Saguinus oedipus]